MSAPQLKANFSVEDKYKAFYTGGVVQISKDGDHLFCQCGHTVECLDINSGKPSFAIGSEDDDEVTSFSLSPDDEILVVASRNLLLKQWNWRDKTLTRTWKASHSGPISCMAFDVTSTLLAAGGADASIKVYDVIKQYCTHNLLGHSGVISVVAFHPDTERLQLVSAGDDYNVRVWDLQTSSCRAVLEGHYSAVQGVQFSPDGDRLYTAGRDNVVIVWDLEKMVKQRTIPVYEAVEALVLLPAGRDFPAQNVNAKDPHFVTGGSKGVLRVWNAATSQCVYPLGSGEELEDDTSRAAITSVQLNAASDSLTVVTHDHNICIHALQDFTPHKHFVGYNDDVLDMQLAGQHDSHLVVATNSPLVKVFTISTWSCQVLRGHTDIVLCVSVNKARDMFTTGSKDNTVRVWQMEADTNIVHCVAIGSGHTHAVNSVSFSRLQSSFIVSASHDCTLKVWPLPSDLPPAGGEVVRLSSSLTEHAHEKEINSVTVTPNDKMIASGSQDKTAKLWSADSLSLLGVFRGHKRSIWCIQFSPVDQALATASADGTIKIWSLTDFSCVKTFEGHQSSVLRVSFITRGMQLISSGSDGLLKLWTIKSNECVGTWDEHDEKVWALAVTADEGRIITGAGGSTICVWKDITEEEQRESLRKQEEFILQEQQLANLLHDKKYVKAIGLAITLNQPFRVLNIFKEMLDADQGREDAVRTLHKLRQDQIDAVLGYCAKWNTNSKHCHVAQFVIHETLSRFSPELLLKLTNIKTTIETLLPYTERHFQRMNRLQQQSTFVEYTWQSMKFSAPLGEEEGEGSHVLTAGSWPASDGLQHDMQPTSSSDVMADDVTMAENVNGADSRVSNVNSDAKSRLHDDTSSEDSDSEEEKIPSKPTKVKTKLQTEMSSEEESDSEEEDIAAKPSQVKTKVVNDTSSDESDSEDEEIPPKSSKVKTQLNNDVSTEESDSEEEEISSKPTRVKTKQTPKSKKNIKVGKSNKIGEDAFASDKENGQSPVKLKNSTSLKSVKNTPNKTPKKTPKKTTQTPRTPSGKNKMADTPGKAGVKRTKSEPRSTPSSAKRRKAHAK